MESAFSVEEIIQLYKDFEIYKKEWHTITFEEYVRKRAEKKGLGSKPLTFGELKPGDKFVDFPVDGDDSGHGGFRKGAYVFEKTEELYGSGVFSEYYTNSKRLCDMNRSQFPDSMTVYKVLF